MRKLPAILAAVVLAVLLYSPPAEARCWWNGYRWHCTHHRYHYWHARHWPYRYYGWYRPWYYYRHHYRPYYAYACVWPFC